MSSPLRSLAFLASRAADGITPTADPPSPPLLLGLEDRLRSAVLLAQLKSLWSWHSWVRMHQHSWAVIGFLLGYMVSVLGGIAVYHLVKFLFSASDAVAVGCAVSFCVLLIAAATGVGATVLDRRAMAWGKRQVAGKIARIVEVFPEAVQALGGTAVLEEEEVVREIIRVLEAGMGCPTSSFGRAWGQLLDGLRRGLS